MELQSKLLNKSLKDARLILTAAGKKFHWDKQRLIVDGVIFDYTNNYKIICNPPKPVSRSYTNTHLLELKSCTVEKIHDGTPFNLYYFEKWCIGTRNGIDVSDVIRFGITHAKALSDCHVNVDELDKKCTYTYIVAHPTWHPMCKKANAVLVYTDDKKVIMPKPLATDVKSVLKSLDEENKKKWPTECGWIIRDELTDTNICIRTDYLMAIERTFYENILWKNQEVSYDREKFTRINAFLHSNTDYLKLIDDAKMWDKMEVIVMKYAASLVSGDFEKDADVLMLADEIMYNELPESEMEIDKMYKLIRDPELIHYWYLIL